MTTTLGVSVTRVSVVIVAWNVARQALECVAALHGGVHGPYNVTVVDNASRDDTVESMRRAYPDVQVVANRNNVGFARACNQGIRLTGGEYILLLNPDCRPVAGAVDRLAVYLDEHGDVAAVGPRVQRLDGSDDRRSPCRLPTLWSDLCDRSGLADAFPDSRLWAGHRLPGWDRSQSSPADGLSGACLMLRRGAVEAIGLLDEGFFLFGEDADLCLRLRRSGWQVHFCGRASVVHQGGASTGQARQTSALHALASRQRFFCKHRGRGYALAHRVANVGLAVAKMVALALPAAVSRKARRTLHLQWRILRWCATGRLDEGS